MWVDLMTFDGKEDFDNFFGAEAFTDAEEFWDVVPGFFPRGIPPHIVPPYPRPRKNGGGK